MKTKIQPKYYPDAKVSCASCGTEWTTGSTVPEIRTEVCSNCHPFYTGQQARILDREGQVDRFYKRLQARQDYVADQKSASQAKTSPSRPVSELNLSTKAVAALNRAEIVTVGDVLTKLELKANKAANVPVQREGHHANRTGEDRMEMTRA